MVLTRQEKEKMVLDLNNRRTPIREIAKQAGMSFRDIGAIVDKAEKEKEAKKEGRSQQMSIATQSYKMFSESKTLVQVAITLNIRANEATQYYREYCALTHLDGFNQIYQETKDDIWYFVNLYRSAKSAGMSIQDVNRVLTITNNHLPSLEYRYESLKREVNSKESEKQDQATIVRAYNDQVTVLGNRLDSCILSCQQEEAKINESRKKRMKEENLVKHFENNNQEYIKITKTIEDKVLSTLLNTKALLGAAVLSIMESVRNNPDKFNSLIYYEYDKSSTTIIADHFNRQYYSSHVYERRQGYFSANDYCKKDMNIIIEEGEKLFNKLARESKEEIINFYAGKEFEKAQKYMDTK